LKERGQKLSKASATVAGNSLKKEEPSEEVTQSNQNGEKTINSNRKSRSNSENASEANRNKKNVASGTSSSSVTTSATITKNFNKSCHALAFKFI